MQSLDNALKVRGLRYDQVRPEAKKVVPEVTCGDALSILKGQAEDLERCISDKTAQLERITNAIKALEY